MLYIAWTLCAAVVVAAAYLTVLYSYRFGKTRTVLWLQSLYFSLLICIFCLHPVIVLITSVCTAVRHRNNMDVFLHHDRSFRDDSQEAVAKAAKAEQEQEDVDSADDDDIGKGIAARQRSRYLRFARPPPERQLLEAREQTMKEKQTFRIVGDVVGYALLLATVAAVAFARDRSHMQRLNESVRAAFVRTPVMAFTDIRSPPDWWTWSNTGLLQGLFPDPHTSKGLQPIVDGTSVLIGQATLRQLRVVAGEACAAGNDTCHHDDDDAAAVRYGPSDLWSFTSGRLLRRHVLRGRHGNYGSGGYVVKISKNREEAKQQLSKLEAGGWIDAKTRAVVVEFTVYNPATNLFSCVSLLLELTSAGVCATLPLVDAVQLYMYGATVRDRLRWVAELAFVAAVLYAAKTEIYRALKWRRKYRDSFWNCVQVVFLAVSIGWIVCYVYRFVLLRGALEHLHMTSHDVYLDLSTVAIWEQVLNALIGIIMFLLIVKALRLFRYNTTLAKFGHIYKAASKELVFYATLFLVLLTAYGQIGVLCFGGAPSGGFRSFPAALGTLLDVVTRNGGVRPLLETSRVVAPIYVGSFVTLVFLLLSAMIKAILNLEYGKYTATSSIPLAYREMGIILWNRMIDYIFAFCCGDDGDGDDDDDTYKTKEDYPVPAELTLAEVQYQVDELLYRMSNISGPLGSSTTDVYPESLTLSDCPGDSEVLHSPDEEAVELKVEKIRQHLLSHDPELAQLLLQNTADLPDDKERDLRSQLELEILRILQGQHGRRDDVSEHSFEIPDETGQAGGYTASRWASEREPVSPAAIPRDAPPPTTTTPRQPTVLICRYDDSNSCSSKSHGSSSSHGPKSTSSQDNAQEPYRPVKAARTPQCRLSVPAAATQDGGGVGDSSSGSDVEALRQARRSATQHRLRKTKSRGKGKGRHAALLSDVDLAALRFCSTDSEPELSSRRRQHPSSAEETTTL